MRYAKVVGINIKYIAKLATQWTGTIFALLGFLGTFVSLGDLLAGQIELYIRIGISALILIIVWLLAFIGNSIYICCKRRFDVLDAGNNHHVYVQYGDIFSTKEVSQNNQKRNVVIPVNRCFDTIVDDDLISSNTLHGKAMQKLYATGIYTAETLNQAIQSNLVSADGHTESLEIKDKRSGNLKRYPVGTVAEVKVDEKLNYFFLGLTCFDKNLHANVSEEEYALALVKLLEFCEIRSQGFPVVMPLVGAGAANNVQKSERDILDYLVMFIKMNRRFINCDIHIVIRDSGKGSIGIADV